MLLEAFLSFLGLGVQPPESSWGILIREGAITMEEYWWLLIFHSVVFSMTLFAHNFLGDGLRESFQQLTYIAIFFEVDIIFYLAFIHFENLAYLGIVFI